ncbi:MAG: 50S ribosomal protein L3 N(5)-glutamine methyltransferase [Pseudomonadota bacterium]
MSESWDVFVARSQCLDTITDWVRFSVSQMQQYNVFFGHGTDNVWDESLQLVFTALALPNEMGEKQVQLLANARITDDEKRVLQDWLFKRTYNQIPLPYLTNTAWFANKPFYVDERVIIPRSPFAELIEENFQPYLDEQFSPIHILDMCTGSACIAITLALAFKDASVDAVDIDTDALDVASINVSNYHLEERVYPIQSDVFASLSGQKYDLIVANPPYVDTEDMSDLPQEFLHEPEHALASGEDGLDLTVRIVKDAAKHLNQNGWLFVEVGNSEVHFAARFNSLDIRWCELRRGGSGIFAISKSQLDAQSNKILNLQQES